MHVRHLSVADFRSWHARRARASTRGPSVLVGANGQGKTNLVEALGYLATLGSHRVATDAPLVRAGAERAVVQCAVVADQRELRVELEIAPGRTNRARLNGAPLRARATCSARCGSCCSRPRISRSCAVTPASGAVSSTSWPSPGAPARRRTRRLRARAQAARGPAEVGRRGPRGLGGACPRSTCGTATSPPTGRSCCRPAWAVPPCGRCASARVRGGTPRWRRACGSPTAAAERGAARCGGRRAGGRTPLPGRHRRPGPRALEAELLAELERPDRPSSNGASTWSGRTATTSSSASASCRCAATPATARAGRWRCRCGWAATSCCARTRCPAAIRCSARRRVRRARRRAPRPARAGGRQGRAGDRHCGGTGDVPDSLARSPVRGRRRTGVLVSTDRAAAATRPAVRDETQTTPFSTDGRGKPASCGPGTVVRTGKPRNTALCRARSVDNLWTTNRVPAGTSLWKTVDAPGPERPTASS